MVNSSSLNRGVVWLHLILYLITYDQSGTLSLNLINPTVNGLHFRDCPIIRLRTNCFYIPHPFQLESALHSYIWLYQLTTVQRYRYETSL